MIKWIDGRQKAIPDILKNLDRPSQLEFKEQRKIVEEIVSDVKKRGIDAILEYSKRFDKTQFNSIEDMLVCKEEIDEAYELVDSKYINIVKKAKDKIWNFHLKQKTNSWISFDDMSSILGQKIQPMGRVGIYVPGGRAAYPSSVLMNAIPARIAGVKEIIMTTPPDSDGRVNPYTLIAADILQIEKIYKLGGAQAVAAMAFGTGSIPKVDKIVGPGNIYVALAKKEVYGYVDIDMIAGPSEILIVADDSAIPSYVAADLLSQAEHDPMATSILVTTSQCLGEEVKSELKRQIESLPRKEIAAASLRDFGAIIITDTIEQGIDIANEIAPEHLELSIENPFKWLGKLKHAGAIFLGNYSPEPLGDYMAGPNHVLPTSGSARFFSPLSVDDFVKKSSIIAYSKEDLKEVYKDIALFARSEGLTAHARSVEVRFEET
mgnify:CR=1 FL=1